jgi:hypothetical protein
VLFGQDGSANASELKARVIASARPAKKIFMAGLPEFHSTTSSDNSVICSVMSVTQLAFFGSGAQAMRQARGRFPARPTRIVEHELAGLTAVFSLPLSASPHDLALQFPGERAQIRRQLFARRVELAKLTPDLFDCEAPERRLFLL